MRVLYCLVFCLLSLAVAPAYAGGQPEVHFGTIGEGMPGLPKNAPTNYLARCLANPGNNMDCAIANDARRDGGLETAVTRTLETVTFDICPDRPKGICVNGPSPSAKSLPVLDMKILFEYDRASLKEGERKKLVQLAKALTDPLNKSSRFAIIGHTDSTGTKPYNCRLSRNRAMTVAGGLGRLGVPPENLVAYGAGEHLLRDRNNGQAAVNRRVGFAPLRGTGSEIIGKIAQVCKS